MSYWVFVKKLYGGLREKTGQKLFGSKAVPVNGSTLKKNPFFQRETDLSKAWQRAIP
jgi:hypothetical protein